jgi:hypothetical protein
MCAALVKEFGPPSALVVEEVPDLVSGPGEAVLADGAVSVDFPDILSGPRGRGIRRDRARPAQGDRPTRHRNASRGTEEQ